LKFLGLLSDENEIPLVGVATRQPTLDRSTTVI